MFKKNLLIIDGMGEKSTEFRVFSTLSDLLRDDFLLRKGNNPRFSVRSYARYLGVSKTALSDTLAQRRHLSRKNVRRIVKRLDLSPEIALGDDRISSPRLSEDNHNFLQMDSESFSVISDWYYFGVLSLARLKKNRSDPRWIAGRLGISPIEVRFAVRILTQMGLIRETRGRLYRTSRFLKTTSDVPSFALRKFQKQNLRLAEDSLDRDPIELRDMTSVTMPTDALKLKVAKEKIKRFREELSEFLNSGNCTGVYTLAIQLFPITRGMEK